MTTTSAVKAALCGAVIALGAVAPAQGAFPGTNGVIAYEHGDDVWVVGADGSDPHLLIPDASDPAWSPDGMRLAFDRSGEASDRSGAGVWVADADGTDLAQVGRWYWAPTWAPDGRRLGVIGPQDRLVVVGADGSDPRVVLGTASPDANDPGARPFDVVEFAGPAWSPDGATIAVPAQPFSLRQGTDLWGIGPDGTGFRRLGGGDGRSFGTEPDWSPDAKHVAFDGDGGVDIRSVSGPAGQVDEPATVPAAGSPAFAPDGTALAYIGGAASPDDRSELWVRTFGGAEHRVAAGAAHPDWQPLAAAPDCTAVHPDPAIIRPVDHRLHRVVLQSPDALARIKTGLVRVSEPPRGGRGPDALRERSRDTVDLRSDRNVAGRGRTYLIGFRLSQDGASCTGSVKVVVPGGADWRHPVLPQPADHWYPAAMGAEG